MIFSRLSTDDVRVLQDLNALFAVVFEDRSSYAENLPRENYVKAFLEDKKNIVLVATDDNQLVGGLVAYVLTKFEQERTEIYIYDLAVAEDRQHQGIGTALIAELKCVSKELGAYIIFVQADEGDDAVMFYESLALTENVRARNFDLSVD